MSASLIHIAFTLLSSIAFAQEPTSSTPPVETPPAENSAPAEKAQEPDKAAATAPATEATPATNADTTTQEKATVPASQSSDGSPVDLANSDLEDPYQTFKEGDEAEIPGTEQASVNPAASAPAPAPAPAAEAEAHDSGGHGAFTIEEMWAAASGPVRVVLYTLLFMMIASFAVGMERWFALSKSRKQSRALASAISPFFDDGKVAEAVELSQAQEYEASYLGRLIHGGLGEFAAREDHYGIEAVERSLEKNIIVENAGLRKGLNILATVGSTAPFVGLVGTIFGIINAFSQIGSEGGADLTTLAPAIGEALITTAFGIIVAIIGVWLFNFFTALIESVTNDMATSSQELLDWCHKRILPEVERAAK